MARSPRNHRKVSVSTALVAVLLLLVTACGGGPPKEQDGGTTEDVPVTEGGEIVIGAEQEPDCADWLGTCSGSIWGNYLMWTATVPVAFNARQDGDDWVPQAS